MPATAGRIRMPANNRLSVSDSLKSSEIWKKSVGYDPYAPRGGHDNDPAVIARGRFLEDSDRGKFGMRRGGDISSGMFSKVPGACGKCGQVGHLTYQCRNKVREDSRNQWGYGEENMQQTAGSSACRTEIEEEPARKIHKKGLSQHKSEKAWNETVKKTHEKVTGRKICRSRRRRRFD